MENTGFFYIYNNKIKPLLCEIDICLKSSDYLTISKTASLLNMTCGEVKKLMVKHKIEKIDTNGFITIMLNGDTYICKLLQRQTKCGVKEKYTPKETAYIYDLDYEQTAAAFDFLEIKEATVKTLPLIFLQINTTNLP